MAPKKGKEDCNTKIRRHIDILREVPPEIKPEEGDIEYGAYTIIKLIFLNYYMGTFLTIANKYSQGRKIFIDAFGGSGLVKIKNVNAYVKGSSLCAALANFTRQGKPTFDEVYSFEIDPQRYSLLSRRFELLQPKVQPKLYAIYGDVNSKITQIHINPNDYVLLFIDPEGLEPDMINFLLFALQSNYVDIIMNISSGVKRVAGISSISPAHLKKLKKFMPNYSLNMSIDDVIDDLFRNYFKKEEEVTVPVNSKGKKEVYKLTLRVRKTKSGSPFVRGMKELVSCLEGLDGNMIKHILETPKTIEQWDNM